MIVSSKGEITDAIEVPDGTELFEFFRVLVMVGDLEHKQCVGQEDFKEFPDDAQVIWAVTKHNGSYAEITKILVPQETLSCGNCDGACYCCDTAREIDAIELESEHERTKVEGD